MSVLSTACHSPKETSDTRQAEQQEKILAEGTSQVGMPGIKNFRERKIVKTLFELRDQEGLTTYTYVFSPMLGKFILVGKSLGFGIPAATQFTNPEKIVDSQREKGYAILPQADPNGLFSPTSADATWVLMLSPLTKKAEPQYFEEKITVTTFPLPDGIVVNPAPAPASTAADPR